MIDKYKCRYHPDREAVIACEKHGYGYCSECLENCKACTDPELYCKFRTHCIIWEECHREIKKKRTQAATGCG
ncbi:MAG: hypothetical protein JRJ12_07965 [Deltaproteobacteria bacterium]|nr:hypothetical protein [Deltaproteobacteria bacterium]MBW2071394.1 hypothetical protein [Deltaproteobacteria bacterium]